MKPEVRLSFLVALLRSLSGSRRQTITSVCLSPIGGASTTDR